MTDKPTVIILRETLWQSFASDTFTLAMAWALIIPGHYIGSSAMEWAGWFVFMVTVISIASGKAKRMTPDEAISHLAEIKAGSKK